MRFLFKIFYNGEKYSGFQRQPNGRGIENFVEMAFIKSKYIHNFKKNGYVSVSRTDTRVNAVCNLFSLNINCTPNLARINSNLPIDASIIIWGFTVINDDLNVGKPLSRTYKYFLPYPPQDIQDQISRIIHFKGKHNFTNFIKKDGAGEENPNIEIFKIEIQYKEKYIDVTIVGERFGREQIRKMIGFLLDPKLLSYQIKDVLKINNLQIHPANPSFLVLNDINFSTIQNWTILQENSNLANIIQKKERISVQICDIENYLYRTLNDILKH